MVLILLKLFLLLAGVLLVSNIAKGQFLNITPNSSDSSITVYLSNSPTSTHGNRIEPMGLTNGKTDIFWLRYSKIFFDSLGKVLSNSDQATMLALTPSKQMIPVNKSALTFQQNQVVALSDTFLAARTYVNSNFLRKTTADSIYQHVLPVGTTGEVWRANGTKATLDKDLVQLWNVDNTSDLNKPISIATNAALNLKVNQIDSNIPGGYVTPYFLAASYATISSLATKQNALSGTGFVKISGSTVSYDTSTYLTTESDPLFDTKFSAKTTSGLAEGSNLYYTNTRARNSVSAGAGITYDVSTGTISNALATVPDSIQVYRLNGAVVNQKIKMLCDTITVTGSASGFTIDISALGFTQIFTHQVVAVRNTSSASASPNVSVKSWTNTSLVLNIVEDNTATQNVLLNLVGGLTSVLSGNPSVFANISGLKVAVLVIGY